MAKIQAISKLIIWSQITIHHKNQNYVGFEPYHENF